ncbi:cytochrome c oxidase subunit 2A [Paenibacillus cremeus]|uniref:Cytochrome c oxidase subunit 2A n=1 Tax=Paenibacillus cremeus TaxID=2163881 RepID=A0A559KBM7_9BACL|nr:cytochrome c oxidase subunit 2A [Paenibacillus cremeus]TVY09521.1 cytochrome c oxidase subunit 2A [Paenibacillus cremeus]
MNNTVFHHLNKARQSKEPQAKSEQEPALKGTFASVLLLGAFVVVTWVAVFVLFLARQ